MRRELRRLVITLAVMWPAAGFVSGAAARAFALLDASPLRPVPWAWALLSWTCWSALTPLVAAIALRFPLRLRNAPVHLAAAAAIATLHWLALAAARHLIAGDPWSAAIYQLPTILKYASLNYALVAAATTVLLQQREARLTTLLRARLERSLESATLGQVVFELDANGILRTLSDAEVALAHDPVLTETLLVDLSRTLREKLGHPIDSGSHRLPRARPARMRPWLLPALFPIFAVYAALLYIAQGMLTHDADVASEVQMIVAFVTASALWPVVWWTARRFPADGVRWRRNLAIVATACLGHATLTELAIVWLRALGVGRPAGETFAPVLLLSAATVSLFHLDTLGRRELAEYVRAQELARELSAARLRSLRTQIAPHFLFNALNTIVGLVQTPAVAARMLDALQRMLRRTLISDGAQQVCLRDDLELTLSYLEIERVRYSDALRVVVSIDDDVLGEIVPAFLLQPLVENAVRHGALASYSRGEIVLRATRVDGALELSVANDCDMIDPASWREGIGLANVRARLAHLYGDRASLEIEPLAQAGVAVRIRIPQENMACAS